MTQNNKIDIIFCCIHFFTCCSLISACYFRIDPQSFCCSSSCWDRGTVLNLNESSTMSINSSITYFLYNFHYAFLKKDMFKHSRLFLCYIWWMFVWKILLKCVGRCRVFILSLRYKAAMIWREPSNRHDDYYFYTTKIIKRIIGGVELKICSTTSPEY